MTEPKPYSFSLPDGAMFSGLDKKLHSVDDKPSVIYADGTKFWYRHGKLHRDGGPAVVYFNGIEEWWQDGKRHRADGPAAIYPNQPDIMSAKRGHKEYWAFGQFVREEGP